MAAFPPHAVGPWSSRKTGPEPFPLPLDKDLQFIWLYFGSHKPIISWVPGHQARFIRPGQQAAE